MKHEMIDFYDETGKHKGTIDKAIAHEKGIWHKSIHAWVVNSKNEVLLQQRCADKDLYPNFWDCSFAGHIGAGETSILSAIREAEEELGLRLTEDEFEFLFTNKEELVWDTIVSKEFVDVFLIRKDIDVDNLIYQKEEVADAKYIKATELFDENKSKEIFPHDEEYKKLYVILKDRGII